MTESHGVPQEPTVSFHGHRTVRSLELLMGEHASYRSFLGGLHFFKLASVFFKLLQLTNIFIRSYTKHWMAMIKQL